MEKWDQKWDLYLERSTIGSVILKERGVYIYMYIYICTSLQRGIYINMYEGILRDFEVSLRDFRQPREGPGGGKPAEERGGRLPGPYGKMGSKMGSIFR